MSTEGRRALGWAAGWTPLLVTLSLLTAVSADARQQSQGAPESATVTAPNGEIRGVISDGVSVFRGIPYARAPTGNRRWQPPQAVAPFAATFSATDFGPACPQPPAAGEEPEGETDEDCLTLNIWSAGSGRGADQTSSSSSGRPVLVWIHGGGFRTGSGANPVYDGARFARDGAVLVTINYRLGALGFLAHPELTERAGGAANFGLLDMIEALRWVRTNIAAFGGDPGRVTVFGESAGGMAVQMLMSSPSAEGLFERAMSLSGYGTWPLPRTDGVLSSPREDIDAYAQGVQILARAGAEAEATLEELLTLDALDLAQAVQGLHLPVVDGVTLPDEPAAVFAAGLQHDVPLVIGGNSYDGAVMLIASMEPASYLESWNAEELAELRSLYRDDFGVDERLAASRMFGDARYLLAARTLATSMAQVDSPAFLYYFAYVPRSMRSTWVGTPHASELGLLFGNTWPWSGEVNDEWREVSRRLRSHVLSFAATGDPNDGSHPAWPEYEAEDDRWLVYGDDPVVRQGVLRTRLDFFLRQYRERRERMNSAELADP